MKSFASHWQGKDGITFFVQGWEPEDPPKALVALVHGLGEHTGRYTHVGEILTKAGYTIVGFDLRGHGKSDGARGHFPSLEKVMMDIKEFMNFLAPHGSGLPRFLYGHSLGGLLALSYAIQYGTGLKGIIVTGAGLRAALQEQKAKVAMAKLLGSLMPAITIQSGLDPTTLSRDSNVVQAYVNDMLVHYSTSLGFGKSALNAIDLCFARAKELVPPLLIMHGTADKLTYPTGSEDFARLVREAGRDVTLKLWEGLYHELHNEPEKAEVLKFMTEWLDQHLS
ncbi:MAG TPA: lysophospholipase [Anaerolineales bacterium]|nr:lysophospholipase [Anaerolineales bacterium]